MSSYLLHMIFLSCLDYGRPAESILRNKTATLSVGVKWGAKGRKVSQRTAATGTGRFDTLAYSEANSSLSGYCSINSRNNFRPRAA